MSRIANAPVTVPNGVEITLSGQNVAVKGPKGKLAHEVHRDVEVTMDEDEIRFKARSGSKPAIAQAGTARALINNLITGVDSGFEKRLTLIGVGYRAQAQGKNLNLSLGFSHPIEFPIPEDVQIETPSQTEVVVRGIDKQRVGQVSAVIRGFRPPEPYKGKGVRYTDEYVQRKEAKKK
jgi:large subunit ribosomal protein L6